MGRRIATCERRFSAKAETRARANDTRSGVEDSGCKQFQPERPCASAGPARGEARPTNVTTTAEYTRFHANDCGKRRGGCPRSPDVTRPTSAAPASPGPSARFGWGALGGDRTGEQSGRAMMLGRRLPVILHTRTTTKRPDAGTRACQRLAPRVPALASFRWLPVGVVRENDRDPVRLLREVRRHLGPADLHCGRRFGIVPMRHHRGCNLLTYGHTTRIGGHGVDGMGHSRAVDRFPKFESALNGWNSLGETGIRTTLRVTLVARSEHDVAPVACSEDQYPHCP